MNQRIRELAEQAGIDFFNSIDPEFSGREYCEAWTEQQQKFAELIVRECAGLFPNVYVEIENEYGHSPVVAADYIKKHFGVGE